MLINPLQQVGIDVIKDLVLLLDAVDNAHRGGDVLVLLCSLGSIRARDALLHIQIY